jgi:hypothetical protein
MIRQRIDVDAAQPVVNVATGLGHQRRSFPIGREHRWPGRGDRRNRLARPDEFGRPVRPSRDGVNRYGLTGGQ